jgi:hypothetical protein
MKIINPQTGAFNIDGLTFEKGTTLDTAIKLLQLDVVINENMQNGWYSIKMVDKQLDGIHYFWVYLKFERLLLNEIDFGFNALPSSQIKGSWDNWGYDEEIQNQQQYNSWLTQEIGEKRTFDWGIAGAYFDQRRGSTGIIIRYSYTNN